MTEKVLKIPLKGGKDNWEIRTADRCKLPRLIPDICEGCRDNAYCHRQMSIDEFLNPEENMKEYICKEVHTENGGYLETECELIRCKNCKHYIKSDQMALFEGECLILEGGTDPECFCSWGEKKE